VCDVEFKQFILHFLVEYVLSFGVNVQGVEPRNVSPLQNVLSVADRIYSNEHCQPLPPENRPQQKSSFRI
jgi:hypothetical protein